MEKEKQGCDYCSKMENNKTIGKQDYGQGINVSINMLGELCTIAKRGNWEYQRLYKINYCPMCGRKLGE